MKKCNWGILAVSALLFLLQHGFAQFKPASNWLTYRNPVFGVEFKYPPEYSVKEEISDEAPNHYYGDGKSTQTFSTSDFLLTGNGHTAQIFIRDYSTAFESEAEGQALTSSVCHQDISPNCRITCEGKSTPISNSHRIKGLKVERILRSTCHDNGKVISPAYVLNLTSKSAKSLLVIQDSGAADVIPDDVINAIIATVQLKK